MIHEYALEPKLLNNWKDFRYFTEKFGFAQGRLISRYPKRWKRMVYCSLDDGKCTPMERKRIEERLKNLDDCMLPRCHEWCPDKDWLLNAEAEHNRIPFRAVLAKENPRGHGFVLKGDDLEDSHPLFHVQQTPITPRSPHEMTALVSPILQSAKEVLFVDPHFGPENKRHLETIGSFLAALVKGRLIKSLRRVEIHTRVKAPAEFFQTEARKNLPRLTPKALTVRLIRWNERTSGEQLHNRYILTDRGGVRVGVGLDRGKRGQTDEIERLGEETHQLRWKQYTSDSAFDRVDEIEIVGTR